VEELLEIFHDTISSAPPGDFTSMCYTIRGLERLWEISFAERTKIEKYLKNNRPTNTGDFAYWWPRGLKEPRLLWLEQQYNVN
jgi:hypothetical protein